MFSSGHRWSERQKDPAWVHNLRADPHIELRDGTIVRPMRVREVKDAAEKARLWTLAVAAYPPYARGIPGAYETSNSGLCRRAVISRLSEHEVIE